MRRYGQYFGFTLSELLVVMAALVLLTVLAVPAARHILASFEAGYGVRKVIGAALANARAVAAKEQCYAGVRFQQDLNGDQYMILIIHDPADPPSAADLLVDPRATGTGLANGFRAVEGKKPLKLPATIGVLDMKLVTNRRMAGGQFLYDETPVNDDRLINDQRDPGDLSDRGFIPAGEFAYFCTDCSTFSIVFSPSGRLVTHNVRIRNRWGRTNDTCPDDVFNTMNQVTNRVGMFFQDDAPPIAPPGFGEEMSRNCFVIYEKKRLDAAPPANRWTAYLRQLNWVYVNPHTGELVND